MSTLREVKTWIAEELPRLIEKYDVPAAAVAVLAGGEVVDDATGVLSLATGVEATPDSVFQIGSITKLWTSTLVMQLVDEGTVDLDVPIRTYLPEFRILDESAAAQITTRQLLSHTSGFEGDIFTDTGLGDDAVEKYLGVLHEVPQLFAPGEQFSYNNAGFCVLGRLVEVLREKPYDACLREYLFAPLGLTHAATSPYEAIMFRAAVGHIEPEPGAGYRPAPVWALARSNAPAGAMLAMRPRDLLTFAQMHMNDGRASDGTQVLAPGTTAAMHARQVDLPDLGMMGTSWGLGFERFDTPEGAIIGHDGGTIGQSAFLRIVPEAGRRDRPPDQRRRHHLALPRRRRPSRRAAHRHSAPGASRASRAPGGHRRRPVRRHLLVRGGRPDGQPGRRGSHLAGADPEGHLQGARREARAQGARPLPGRQPDPRRARARHAHAARLRRR